MSRTGLFATDELRLTDPPHPVYERDIRCIRCRIVKRVAPCHEHLNPDTFVCGPCATEASGYVLDGDGRLIRATEGSGLTLNHNLVQAKDQVAA